MANFYKVVMSVVLFLVSTSTLVIHKCSILYLILLARSKTMDILSGYLIMAFILLFPQLISILHMLWNIPVLIKQRYPVVPPIRTLVMDMSMCILEPACLVVVVVGLPSTVPVEILLFIAPLAFLYPLYRMAFTKPKVLTGQENTMERNILSRWTRTVMSVFFIAFIFPYCALFILYMIKTIPLVSAVTFILAFPTLGFVWTRTLGIDSKDVLVIRTSRRIHYVYAVCKIIFTIVFLFFALYIELGNSYTRFYEAFQNWTSTPYHINMCRELASVFVVVVISACSFLAVSFLSLSYCQPLIGSYFPSLISIVIVLGLSALVRFTYSSNTVIVTSPCIFYIIFISFTLVAILYACGIQCLSSTPQVLMMPFDQLLNDYLWNFVALDLKLILSAYTRSRTVGQSETVQLDMKSVLFVCATMYKEDKEEMSTLVKSLQKLAASRTDRMGNVGMHFHIFFDDGCQGNVLSKNAKQLLNILHNLIHVSTEHFFYKTPYGLQYRANLPINSTPITVHFKDNQKFKCKKRWSQAMYIHYILNFYLKNTDKTRNKSYSANTETINTSHYKGAYVEHICEVADSLAHNHSSYQHSFKLSDSILEKGRSLRCHLKPKIGAHNGLFSAPSINRGRKSAFQLDPAAKMLPVIEDGLVGGSVMNYREAYGTSSEADTVDPNNIFVLALDGDIEFEPEAVYRLYSKCRSDSTVGGVCGRTHPRALGPSSATVWYQTVEYSNDFWLSKNAQNVFGSVTCCPGCFAMFRASALKDVVHKLCEPTENSSDVYLKDSGEDRWITSLLIFQGWNVKYDYKATNWTYCPVSFSEFMRQRKRWILSDLSNDLLLLSKAPELIRKNQSFTGFFTLYLLIVFSWKITQPANMICLMAQVFSKIFGVSYILFAILILCIIVGYVIMCLLTSGATLARVMVAFGVLLGVIFIVDTVYLIYSALSALIALSVNDPVFYLLLLPLVTAGELILGAVFHLRDMHYLMYWPLFLVYTPTALVLFPIYSVCGIGDQRWGTRDGATGEDNLMCHSFSSLTSCRKGENSRISVHDSDSEEENASEEVAKAIMSNLRNMADDPLLAPEAEFWEQFGKTTLGTDVNMGTDSKKLRETLDITRWQCLAVYLLTNLVMLTVQSLLYLFSSKDLFHPGIYIMAIIIGFTLIKTVVHIVGMFVHRLNSVVRSTGFSVYGRDFPVWRPSTSLSVAIEGKI